MQNLPMHIYSAFQQAENPEILLRGIKKYLGSVIEITHATYDIIEEKEGVKLRYYQSSMKSQVAIFIVPSLINGPEIFDLTETYSFIRYCSGHNIDVYLVDWQELNANYNGGLDDLLGQILKPLWTKASEHTDVPLNVLGYCLGGTFAAHFFSTHTNISQPVTITFLATPLDFKAPTCSWKYISKNPDDIKNQIRLNGTLSQRMLQSHFINLQPDYVIRKFEEFLDMQENSNAEQRFIAVENWLNSGTDLPQKLALDLLDTYFIENESRNYLQQLDASKLIFILSDTDQVVPYESAYVLDVENKKSTLIKSHCGHVGMMVGRDAEPSVWRPFTEHIHAIAAQQKQAL